MGKVKKYSFLKQYSFLSLSLMIAFGLLLGIVLSSFYERVAINTSKHETVMFVVHEVDRLLSGVDLASPMTGREYDDRRRIFEHFIFNSSIKRIKVWNTKGTIVWSDDRELVGKRFPNDADLKKALGGMGSSEIRKPDKPENASERGFARFIEIYIPIHSGSGEEVRAVIELYQDLGHLYEDIYRMKKVLWVSILIGFTGFYFACFGIVWRASLKITEQMEDIEQSEQRFRALADAAPDGIVNVNASGDILFVNPAVERQFGYADGELAGKNVTLLIPHRYRDAHLAGMERFIGTGNPRIMGKTVELEGLKKDGSEFPIELSLATWESKGDRLFSAIIRDITERKKATETLSRLGLAVNQSAEAIVVTDPDGVIQYINPSFERISGFSASEAVGQNMRIVKSGKQSAEFYREMWSTISAGRTWKGHMVNRREDGTLFAEETTISPVFDRSGRIRNFVGVKRDVTRERALEKQVHTAQRMESVGTLAGGIAHDFNNALTGILGYCDLLRLRLGKDKDSQKDLDEIFRAAERAAMLTRQLLTFARRQVMEPVNLSLGEVVGEMIRFFSKVAGSHIAVKTSLSGETPTVRADRGQVEQVMMNLCLNARDAMPHGGQLLIETEAIGIGEEHLRKYPYMKPGRYALLSVSDTGIGMDEATRERIFDPFFTTKGPEKGTGLGLSVVYGIVKQHKGYIHVYSEPGKGTTFRVYLPGIDSAPDAPKSGEPSVVRGGHETILLAEDEEAIRGLAERVLKEYGYTVLAAKDGEEAVGLFREHGAGIDLAVLDVVMPRKGGKDAYEKMRAIFPDLKVVFMSGYSANAVHEGFVIKTGTPFLGKPFSPTSLARKVREVLGRK